MGVAVEFIVLRIIQIPNEVEENLNEVLITEDQEAIKIA